MMHEMSTIEETEVDIIKAKFS